MSTNDKRRHPRKDVFSPVLVALADQGYLTEAWDLSRGGTRLGRPQRWDVTPGAQVRVYFMLDQQTVSVLDATVARVGKEHLGLQFSAGQDDRVEALLYEARFSDRQTV